MLCQFPIIRILGLQEYSAQSILIPHHMRSQIHKNVRGTFSRNIEVSGKMEFACQNLRERNLCSNSLFSIKGIIVAYMYFEVCIRFKHK